MNIKECLLQYTDTQSEIKLLEEKIKKLEIKSNSFSIVEASSLSPPFQKKNVKVQHTDIKAKRELEYLRCLLGNRYERLLEQQTKVEEFIDKLPTSRLRMIFEYRYFRNYSWIKVAYSIGGQATERSVRAEHDRFLEKK